MSAEVFKKFYVDLITTLPMNDILFVSSLWERGIFSGDLQEHIESLSSSTEKAEHFLTVAINPLLSIKDDSTFSKLLSIMEDSDYKHVKELARQIRRELQERPAIITKTTYEKFMEKYLRAKHYLGSEKLNLLKIIFFGPSGAGKSTLLDVLLQKDIKLLQESTGILDQKLVQFKVAVERDTSKSISQWKKVTIDEEILRLRHTIEEKIAKRTDSNILPLKANMKIDEKLQSVADSLPESAGSHLVPKNEDQISKVQLIASNTLIACYDSGGQPEFFDIMPAMTTITTGNIMVLDMSKNLHLKLDSEFFKQGKLWKSSDTKTHYTTVQLLKTALANIQSHATQYSSRSATNICCKNSQLLVVGTHLDLCGDTEDKKRNRLHEIEKIIWDDVLHDCSPISIIHRQKNKNTKIIHPIANRSDKDSDEVTKDREEAAQEIRTAIESMSNNDNVNKEIPVSWLLFQYEIKLQSGPCILRSDCEEIAKKCYIDEVDIDDVLSFFHEVGILLYYKQVKKLEHVVFSDPQWLFNQLTKIIELKYDPSYEAEKSIKKGIFKKNFLAEIFGKEFEPKQILRYEDLLNLFIHLNIMAGLSDTEEQYFMPALLNPAPIPISLDEEFGNKVFSTLYIRYKDGLFPQGVFCCLIALSIQKNKTWKLQTNAAYKNVVVFQIEGNREYLILFDKVNYILVEIHHKNNLLPNSHQVLFSKLHENLIEVCSKIHLNGDFNFGFLCENCESSESFASAQVQHPCCPENLFCAVCQHNPKVTYDQLIWFIPPNVLDILNTKHSRGSNDSSSKHKKRKTDMKEPTPASGGDSGNVVDNVSVKDDDDDDDDDDGVIEEPCLSNKDEDKDDVIVDELWKEEELCNMGYQKKKISTLPSAQKSNILDQVLLLLLTVNNNEDNAALCYLEPLPHHNEIFKYWQRDDAGIHAEHAMYRIGKYGACPAAVRQIKPGSDISGATTAPILAFRCFKNLNAIIGMGVACGVEKKAKLCDVLVADKVNNYDQARLEEGGTLNRGLALPTSRLLSEIFRQRILWPDDKIKERLDKCKMKPKIKQGVILSGPYLIDNKKIKKDLIQNFASEAIGIEMEAAYLFRAAQQVPTHMTIVKAVCDFGDGKKNKDFQPTAALLAANCVKRYLDEGAVEMLQRESHNKGEDDQDYTSPNNERSKDERNMKVKERSRESDRRSRSASRLEKNLDSNVSRSREYSRKSRSDSRDKSTKKHKKRSNSRRRYISETSRVKASRPHSRSGEKDIAYRRSRNRERKSRDYSSHTTDSTTSICKSRSPLRKGSSRKHKKQRYRSRSVSKSRHSSKSPSNESRSYKKSRK